MCICLSRQKEVKEVKEVEEVKDSEGEDFGVGLVGRVRPLQGSGAYGAAAGVED